MAEGRHGELEAERGRGDSAPTNEREEEILAEEYPGLGAYRSLLKRAKADLLTLASGQIDPFVLLTSGPSEALAAGGESGLVGEIEKFLTKFCPPRPPTDSAARVLDLLRRANLELVKKGRPAVADLDAETATKRYTDLSNDLIIFSAAASARRDRRYAQKLEGEESRFDAIFRDLLINFTYQLRRLREIMESAGVAIPSDFGQELQMLIGIYGSRIGIELSGQIEIRSAVEELKSELEKCEKRVERILGAEDSMHFNEDLKTHAQGLEGRLWMEFKRLEEEEKQKAEREKNLVISVQGAVNPLRAAALAGQMDKKNWAVAERRDVVYDLAAVLEQDRASYRLAGLKEWADNLPAKGEFTISDKDLAIIISCLQYGAIPIFMPGKSTQRHQFVTSLIERLKPLIKQRGLETERANNADSGSLYRWLPDDLVAGLPERPYILMAWPGGKVYFAGLSPREQVVRLHEKQIDNPDWRAMRPTEFGALQKIFSERFLAAYSSEVKTYLPIGAADDLGTNCVECPEDDEGFVLSCRYNTLFRNFEFNKQAATAPSHLYGVRQVIRIELTGEK